MDKVLRSLERQAALGEDILKYARALRRMGDPRCVGMFRYAVLRGELAHPEEEEFLAKSWSRRGTFPVDYVGFAVIEADESAFWSPNIITKVGYVGGVYLIDLTRRIYIADSTPVYAISSLYYSAGGEVDDEMDAILSESFADQLEIDYTTRAFLGHVINWVLIHMDDYYDPYDNRPVMEQLRQRLIENRVL